jgi:hypothetical protein
LYCVRAIREYPFCANPYPLKGDFIQAQKDRKR